MTIFGAILFASVIFTNCGGGKSESDKTSADSTKIKGKDENPKSDSKEAIKAISEKYYIPVDESKSDLIFTINQNLNFSLLNYKGSFEGKYVEGKVQFDDKNTTLIDFALKGENVVLKNQNDVAVEFRVATENEILSGTWAYIYDYATRSCHIVFDTKGNWSITDDPAYGTRKGHSKSLGNRKFNVIKYSGSDANFKLTDINNGLIYWTDSDVTYKHTRSQKGKLQSLNQIFN